MEHLYLQNPTLKFAQQAHSYSSGMIQVLSQTGLFRNSMLVDMLISELLLLPNGA